MKKLFTTITICMLYLFVQAQQPYPVAPAAPGNITAIEYFIDNNDPGFGNAIPITFTQGTNIASLNANINITGLAPGVHRLLIRSKDANGKWSITNSGLFDNSATTEYPAAPAPPAPLAKMEYFIDTDPGFGNATPIALTPGINITDLSVNINTIGLADGPHTLYIRSQNSDGKWSLTNQSIFSKGILTLSILPDSIVFFNTIINATPVMALAIKNTNASPQTITSVTVGAPFSTDFSATRTINPGNTDTLHISFSPTAVNNYQDTIRLQTSAGNYKIMVKGTAIAFLYSWVLEPVTGHDYGNVQTGSSSNFDFTIRNTGNTSVTLDQVITGNPAFVPTYSTGTVIPANGTINVPVAFNPSTVGTISTSLKIKATAGGPDSVSTIVNGSGYTPAVPPVLSFVSAAPYSGISGVNPVAGQTGNYTYKILYQSADNRPPAAGYPQVGIDIDGNQDFNGLGEGKFTMVKEGNSTDYITGVVYTYSIGYLSYTNLLGYRFFAQDALGNPAVANDVSYKSGPLVTFQTLDLKLFANDISFSKANPNPGETFTVTAKITNNSAFNVVNVPVSFYRDTTLIGSDVMPAVNAFSTATISRILSFGADGFYPIKVWIDPNKTLNENNVLNNYAIRPVIVGIPILPGGINVSASATVQDCPAQKIVFTGHADYFGTAIPTVVAGAEVTINTGTALLQTTTDAEGNFNLILENPACGNTLTYTVSVTDFTFTSSLFTGSVNVLCAAPNACGGTPGPAGGASVTVPTTPCANVTGQNTSATLTIKYRERNIATLFSQWDKIWKDTVKVFSDGVLIQTFATPDIPGFGSAGTFPGDVKIIPVAIPLGTQGPHSITVVATYEYNEFLQNEDNNYHGERHQMTATANGAVNATPDKPDLGIENFQQPNYRAITFDDANKECVSAGQHIVSVVDVTNPGSPVLLKSDTIANIAGRSLVQVTVNLASLTFGIHKLRIVTDTTALVVESNEDNNVLLVTINIPKPDLTVGNVAISPTNLSVGSPVSFTATIKNTGTATGPLDVRFLANGVLIGADINVSGIGENGTVEITSNSFIVPTADNGCPINITVIADAGSVISESNEANNSFTFKLGSDINPAPLSVDFGSQSNPVKVRVNTSKQYEVLIRNVGTRDITNVTVKFMHNGIKIGEALVPVIVAGKDFPAVASFTHTFTTVGLTTVDVVTDTANAICEIDETNNTAAYNINVTESKEDYEVLSQYISPSSLNPNFGQNITIVGTVKNIGNKVAPPNTLRFYVDNIPLGADVPFNSLQIGQDTTVAATMSYSSKIAGLKIIRIVVDESNTVAEEDENNNEATRLIIVGDAPDLTRNVARPIAFNPNGFDAGDSVTVSYQIKNVGTTTGTAWARLKIFDAAGTFMALDSVQFSLISGANTTISKRMFFAIDSGYVVAEIANCLPLESDLLNNTDTLYFSHVAKMKASITVNNLDMKAGAPQQLPGWIGGKIELGDFDLTVNGNITNADTSHFIITNGTGKLLMINNNAENIFPVGTNLYSTNFVKINNTGTADNFSVRLLPYALKNGTSGDTVHTANVNVTWLIEEQVAGGSNGTVEMFWNLADELPGFDRSQSKAAHYTSIWELGAIGAAITDSIGRYSKIQSGYTSFSPFTVTNNIGGALPLHLLQFTAEKQGANVLLKWKTTDEVNTARFIVQHSIDGNQFADAGTITAKNTLEIHNYEFVHSGLQEGTNFYRLKMVDIDGHFTYSVIRTIIADNNNQMQVYPNPASQFVTVRGLKAGGTVQLISVEGKTLQQFTTNSSSLTIDLNKLPGGVYIIQYRKDNNTQMQRILKQ